MRIRGILANGVAKICCFFDDLGDSWSVALEGRFPLTEEHKLTDIMPSPATDPDLMTALLTTFIWRVQGGNPRSYEYTFPLQLNVCVFQLSACSFLG